MVEDSPIDVLLTREAIGQAQLANTLHVVEDGEEAMDFLRKMGRHGGTPRPDLVLLDWNLPRKSGKEVLGEIKSDEDLKVIPVIVRTSSRAEVDVLRAYGLHANCYITKPGDFSTFVDVGEEPLHRWHFVRRRFAEGGEWTRATGRMPHRTQCHRECNQGSAPRPKRTAAHSRKGKVT